MDKIYKINNTTYLDPPEDYLDPDLYPDFQINLEKYKNKLITLSNDLTSTSFLRFGDGEYRFLKKIPSGSARPGVRALKKDYSKINITKFEENLLNFDIYQSLIQKAHVERFSKIFGHKNYDFPIEYTYGLIANKWFFENLKCKIGVIGGSRKINLIKKLMNHKNYQEYIGIEKFNSYISVPQKFIVDKSEATLRKLKHEINSADCDLFLFGIGQGKLFLIPELQNLTSKVFIDIGIGIDALAGIVNIKRPYFGLWQNYQFKNSLNYRRVDYTFRDKGTMGEIKYVK